MGISKANRTRVTPLSILRVRLRTALPLRYGPMGFAAGSVVAVVVVAGLVVVVDVRRWIPVYPWAFKAVLVLGVIYGKVGGKSRTAQPGSG